MHNISTLFVILTVDYKLIKSEPLNSLISSRSIYFFFTNIKVMTSYPFLSHLPSYCNISATIQYLGMFYLIICKILRRLRPILAYSIQIHIHVLPIWRSLRKLIHMVDCKFDKMVRINTCYLSWSLGRSLKQRYIAIFYTSSILSTKIMVFGITPTLPLSDTKNANFIFWHGDLSNHICNIWLIQQFWIKSGRGSKFERFAYIL